MQAVQITCLALLLAHLLGDFPLQARWISQQKGRGTWPLICHGIIHYVIAWICLALFGQVAFANFYQQSIVVAYVLVHLSIDRAKCFLTARRIMADDWKTFLLDQALHLMVVAIAAALLSGSSIGGILAAMQISAAQKVHLLEAAIVYVAVIFGGGYLIRYLTRSFAVENTPEVPTQLKNAGLYVGWIERFLIVTAIVVQSPVLVGLILTGKSIARFPEFKEARFAEYFLVGTLLSISISLVGGIALLQMLYGTILLK